MERKNEAASGDILKKICRLSANFTFAQSLAFSKRTQLEQREKERESKQRKSIDNRKC